MLVRTSKRIAGFPPPGVVGEVDDERATAAIERGDAEDMSSLSARLRRKPESPDPFAFEMVEGGFSDERLAERLAEALDEPLVALDYDLKPKRPKAEREAKHPNDGS